jgi:uncharacterized protein YwgA
MEPRDVVLILLDAYGGQIRGRTLLQKVCYFADVKAGLALRFRAHYYGPYSSIVEESVEEAKALGFVSEEPIPWGVSSSFGELRRFDYRLTEDGRIIVAELKKRKPEESSRLSAIVKEIRTFGDPDYRELSLAAKTYFILHKQKKPVTMKELEMEAKRFNWKLSSDSVNKATDFLCRLGLAKKGE